MHCGYPQWQSRCYFGYLTVPDAITDRGNTKLGDKYSYLNNAPIALKGITDVDAGSQFVLAISHETVLKAP